MGEATARALQGMVRRHGPLAPAMAATVNGRRYSWSGEPGDLVTVERQARYEDADLTPGNGWAWVPTDDVLPAPDRRTVTAFLARIHDTL